MAHDAMMAYSTDGAKIVITEASNAAIGSNKWNYEQIDANGGTAFESPMPVISFTATSASLNNPTAMDTVPARQDALEDAANWFYRTCPVSNNLSAIRLNEIFGGLARAPTATSTTTASSRSSGSAASTPRPSRASTVTSRPSRTYLGTPAGMAAIGTKTFISENVSFDPGTDPTSFDYTPYITQATDAHNEQTAMPTTSFPT